MSEQSIPSRAPVQTDEVRRLDDQLERSFEGDAWHGSSISEILTCITAEQAAAHPIPGAHSIWEIVLHTTVWQRTVRERLQGRPIRPLPREKDWPSVSNPSAEAWAGAVRELRDEYELLREETRSWSPEKLDETVEGQRFTVYQMLHGVIQHGLYHAGQIAILARATEVFEQ